MCINCNPSCSVKSIFVKKNPQIEGVNYIMTGKNIILLGESGEGKSTWLNSLPNYALFDTYDRALQGPPKKVIKDENSGDSASSGTKLPTAYEFLSKEGRILIIDTPGLNDTEDQDLEHIENIFQGLSHFSELHAICIVMKSTTNRLSPTMKILINEMLKNFHKSASENIVFCYTHVMDFEDVEDMDAIEVKASKVLEKYFKVCNIDIALTKYNQFYFNNLGYQYIRQHLTSTENRETSWRKSASESRRFLEYVHSLKPHVLEDTLSLIEMKNRIRNALEPICVVTDNASHNLATEKGSYKIITIDLPESMIICKCCTQMKEIPLPDGSRINYPVMKNCKRADWSMFGIAVSYFWGLNPLSNLYNCDKCGCKAKVHKVTNYACDRIFIPETIEKGKLLAEIKKILDVTAHCTHFLQQNSLSSSEGESSDKYNNDCFIQKIAEAISNEKHNLSRMKSLEEVRTWYIAFLFECQKGKCLALEEINNQMDELFTLPINGPGIKDLFDRETKLARKAFERHTDNTRLI